MRGSLSASAHPSPDADQKERETERERRCMRSRLRFNIRLPETKTTRASATIRSNALGASKRYANASAPNATAVPAQLISVNLLRQRGEGRYRLSARLQTPLLNHTGTPEPEKARNS